MKKNYLKWLMIVLLISIISVDLKAEIVTVYQSVDPVKIYTLQGTGTIMEFPMEIETAAVGSEQAFTAKKTESKNKLLINALKPSVWTNLIVYDQENNRYVFRLEENSNNQSDYYDLVIVKLKESLPYDTILKIMRNDKYSVDPDIMNLVDMYEVGTNEFIKGDIKLELKRCAKINNTDETVYWIRINNNSEESFIINSLGLKERENKFIITQDEIIDPKKYGDFYLITRGRKLSDNLTVNITVSKEEHEIELKDIPYKVESFKVFQIN